MTIMYDRLMNGKCYARSATVISAKRISLKIRLIRLISISIPVTNAFFSSRDRSRRFVPWLRLSPIKRNPTRARKSDMAICESHSSHYCTFHKVDWRRKIKRRGDSEATKLMYLCNRQICHTYRFGVDRYLDDIHTVDIRSLLSKPHEVTASTAGHEFLTSLVKKIKSWANCIENEMLSSNLSLSKWQCARSKAYVEHQQISRSCLSIRYAGGYEQLSLSILGNELATMLSFIKS